MFCVCFFSCQSQGCFSFMKGWFREVVAPNLNYLGFNSLYRAGLGVSPRTHTHTYTNTYTFIFTVDLQQCKQSMQTCVSKCVCVYVSGTVTCMMRTLFFMTTELSVQFSCLFTDAALLMYSFGSEGSSLTMTT